jgi:hypothetical protein
MLLLRTLWIWTALTLSLTWATPPPTPQVVNKVVRAIQQSATQPDAFHLMNQIHTDITAKRKADKEQKRLANLEAELRQSMAKPDPNEDGATGSKGATGGDGGVGATGGASTGGTGATGSQGSTGSVGSNIGGQMGSSSTGSSSTGSSTGTEQERLTKALNQTLNDFDPTTSKVSPLNLTEQIIFQTDQELKREKVDMKQLESNIMSSVNECTAKSNAMQKQIAGIQKELSASAHILLDLNKRSREPIMVLRDVYPILEQYAIVVATSKASSKMEFVHLDRQNHSLTELLHVVDELQQVVDGTGSEISAIGESYSEGAIGSSATGGGATGGGATGGSATGGSATGSSATGSSATGSSATGSSATGSSATGNGNSFLELQSFMASATGSAPQAPGQAVVHKMSVAQHQRKEKMATALEAARVHLITILVDDMHGIAPTTRKQRHAARDNVDTIMTNMGNLLTKIQRKLKKKAMHEQMDKMEHDLLTSPTMMADIANIRTRLVDAKQTLKKSKDSIFLRNKILNLAIDK